MTGKEQSGVMFVDLDGTLTLDNSFHLMLASLWRAGRARTRIALVAALLTRLVRPHSGRLAMKRRVLEIFDGGRPDVRAAVVEDVQRSMRVTLSEPVRQRIEQWSRAKGRVVLATAAPMSYAAPFARGLGLDDCVATAAASGGTWHELSGEAKARACRDWLARHDVPASADLAVVTDHLDDLPLTREAHTVILQASPESFARLSQEIDSDKHLEHIDPVSAQDGGGCWLWFDDAPKGPLDEWEVRTILSKHRYALMYAGAGSWERVRPGDTLTHAVLRVECPVPPSTRARLVVAAERRIVRDRLGIFH
jgi:phosphoserine phosphatase